MSEDYSGRLICRTCLATDVEFVLLSSIVKATRRTYQSRSDCGQPRPSTATQKHDNDHGERANTVLTLLDCLQQVLDCTDAPEFPMFICLECSYALKVAYVFLCNARDADKILRERFGYATQPVEKIRRSGVGKQQQRHQEDNVVNSSDAKGDRATSPNQMATHRYRCKICGDRMDTKRALKEHVKVHLDLISYRCQLCAFECAKRSHLADHYVSVHELEPTRDHLKPQTSLPSAPSKSATSAATPALPTAKEELQAATETVVELPIAEALYPNASGETELLNLGTNYVVLNDGSVGQVVDNVPNGVIIQYIEDNGNTEQVINEQLLDNLDITTQTHLVNSGQVLPFEPDEQAERAALSAAAAAIAADLMDESANTVEEMEVDDIIVEEQPAFNEPVKYETFSVRDANMAGEVAMPVATPPTPAPPIVLARPTGMTVQPSPPARAVAVQTTMDTRKDGIAALRQQMKSLKCKVCTAVYSTQEKLKTHMLTHNEIPHFFCDQCPFYTFFKVDLQQHYQMRHSQRPTMRQLQPKNRNEPSTVAIRQQPFNGYSSLVYACDLCLFETPLKGVLRRHYSSRHNITATDIQLRPVQVGLDIVQPVAVPSSGIMDTPTTVEQSSSSQPVAAVAGGGVGEPGVSPEQQRDYPNGVNCFKCNRTFYYRTKLREHYRHHRLEENQPVMQLQSHSNDGSLLKSGGGNQKLNNNAADVAAQQLEQQQQHQQHQEHIDQSESTKLAEMFQDLEEIIPSVAVSTSKVSVDDESMGHNADTMAATEALQAMYASEPSGVAAAAAAQAPPPTTTTAVSMVPSDAVPQIVEMDIIENDIDFDFNGDAFFEDFDVEQDGAANGDKSAADNSDNLLLTTDDEQNDDEAAAANGDHSGPMADVPRLHCAHCNKDFQNDYQFQNHMFVHRGLAPYRCELCTNLYNIKRALLRHYKAVHKVVPTRDMLQAKGDKVCGDLEAVEHLNFTAEKATVLMCASCPFENIEWRNVREHVMNVHTTPDVAMADKFILIKQPHDCPRCIRAFASKERLIRHLADSHSVESIIQENQMPSSLTVVASGNNLNVAVNSTTEDSAVLTEPEPEVATPTATDAAMSPAPSPPNSPTTTTTINTETAGDGEEASEATAEAAEPTQSEPVHITEEEVGLKRKLDDSSPAEEDEEAPNIEGYSEQMGIETDGGEEEAAAAAVVLLPDVEINLIFDGKKVLPIEQMPPQTQNEEEKKSPSTKTKATQNESHQTLTYQCTYCQRHYRTELLLKQHMRRHTGRRFQCMECCKTYVTLTELRKHQVTHTGHMPHLCDLCGKRFYYEHHLKRHKDSYHLQRRHMCSMPHCNRAFTSLTQLRMHVWDHYGLRPYRCKFCARVFKVRGGLRKHALLEHDVELTDAEMAEIYRQSTGHTNPHDFTVSVSNGQMLRRNDIEMERSLHADLQVVYEDSAGSGEDMKKAFGITKEEL